MAFIRNVHAIDQAQIVDVDRNFRVENIAQRGNHAFVQIAARFAGGNAFWLGGKEAFQIVALAFQLFRCRFGCSFRRIDCVCHFRPGRLGDPVHRFGLDRVCHPKILIVRSIPLTSAATSLSSL